MPKGFSLKKRIEVIFILLGIAILAASSALGMEGSALNTAIILAFIVVIAPFGLLSYQKHRLKKALEEQFTDFIRDLKESLDSGMTLPLALEHCSKRDYLELTPHVAALSSQVSWGIPFKKAFVAFAKNTDSRHISKTVNMVIEAYDVGGKISETLGAVIGSLTTIERLKREREASIRSQTFTIYFIFFIFIFILIAIDSFLIPSILASSKSGGLNGSLGSAFLQLIIIQGLFSGLAIGKMAEGSIAAGFRHSLILMLAGYFLFTSSGHLPLKELFGF